MKYTERNALYSIPLSRPLEISFGVKSGQPQLLAVLNKTLKAMPIGMLSSSFSMHENAKHKVTLEDYIKDNLLLFSASFLLVTLQILSISSCSCRRPEKRSVLPDRQLEGKGFE